jgi:hypothetical protein
MSDHLNKQAARSGGCKPGWRPAPAIYAACQARSCALLFRRNFIHRPKWLIEKDFEIHPEFLWITLLTVCPTGAESPINQGFEHNARKFGSLSICLKSTTYKKTGAITNNFHM